MRYRKAILQRIVQSGIALLGLFTFIFFISRVLPSNPARLMLGPRATQEAVDELYRQMGLHKPIYFQFIEYLVDLIRGDWGVSIVTKQPVLSDIVSRFPASLELTTTAMTVAIVFGTFLGIKAAMDQNGSVDHMSRWIALSGVSVPKFWSGILLQLIIAFGLGWLPATGRFPQGEELTIYTDVLVLDSLLNLDFGALIAALQHLVLPSLVLSFGALAQIMRMVRSEMVQQREKEYILTAQANGMPSDVLVYKYMLKNAFTSGLTVIGLTYGFMLGNAFVVEFVFSWPGLGRYGVDALLNTDYNAIVGLTLVIGLWFALVNSIVDGLYSYLDPRIRLDSGGG